jgi:hypothetical protein
MTWKLFAFGTQITDRQFNKYEKEAQNPKKSNCSDSVSINLRDAHNVVAIGFEHALMVGGESFSW